MNCKLVKLYCIQQTKDHKAYSITTVMEQQFIIYPTKIHTYIYTYIHLEIWTSGPSLMRELGCLLSEVAVLIYIYIYIYTSIYMSTATSDRRQPSSLIREGPEVHFF